MSESNGEETKHKVLAYQVEDCPDCKVELDTQFGLAGGGFGPYGWCPKCGRLIWKCNTE